METLCVRICSHLSKTTAVVRPSWSWKKLYPHDFFCWYKVLRYSSSSSSPSSSVPSPSSTTSSSPSISSSSISQGVVSEEGGQVSRGASPISPLRTRSKFFRSRMSRLTDMQSRQFLTSNKETIVCVHPVKQTPLEETKPLRPFKPHLAQQRTSLTSDEVELVKKLRHEDGSLWTVNTLARLFNVKRVVIRKVAPASLERQEELKKEQELLASMKFYKRKLYKAEREMRRQKRLEEIISQNETLSSIRAHHQLSK